MNAASPRNGIMRRTILRAGMGLTGMAVGAPAGFAVPEDDAAADGRIVERLLGRPAALSPRVHLNMPPVFANGYSVPLTLSVDSPMTEAEHVRVVHVLAPWNPIVPAAAFHFTPQSGAALVSTRVRLAKSQFVLAVADMSDGALLMARTWVKVDINGCA
jgi:sulfur-oxidizing protein SoxY